MTTRKGLIDLGLFPPPPVSTPGVARIQVGVYVFECPVCRKRFRYDDPYEPMCTGPSETTDEHDPAVMGLVGTETRQVML